MENIDVPSGMGDYTITLTRDETENYLKIEDAVHCARRTVPGGVPVSSDLFFSRQGTVHKVTLSVLRSRENSVHSVEKLTGQHTPYTFPIITEQCNGYSLSGNTSRFSQRLIQKGFFCLIPA